MKLSFVATALTASLLAQAATVTFYENDNYGGCAFSMQTKPLSCQYVGDGDCADYILTLTKRHPEPQATGGGADGNATADAKPRVKRNDMATSIKISDNVECRFWDNAGCPTNQGYLTVKGSTPNVGKNWNDKISSFSCFG